MSVFGTSILVEKNLQSSDSEFITKNIKVLKVNYKFRTYQNKHHRTFSPEDIIPEVSLDGVDNDTFACISLN